MTKTKLLFIAPDHYGFYEVILNGLKEDTSYSVDFFCSNFKPYEYKNLFERIFNFFSKAFLNHNIKNKKKEKAWNDRIEKPEFYDLLFIIRPDIFNENQLKKLIEKCDKSIVYYWDSFEKIEDQKDTLHYFDIKYSFDKNDCLKYGMKIGHNFFFNTKSNDNPEFDVFFLGTYDKRYSELLRILSILQNNKLNAHAKLYIPPNANKTNFTHPNISVMDKIVPFNKAYIFSMNTRIILDIQHENQIGLSFRPFEAMGLGKKLITTNEHIKTHDFYNPNNIFVITKESKAIPNSFLTTPYEKVPPVLLEKYSLKGWINEFIPKKKN